MLTKTSTCNEMNKPLLWKEYKALLKKCRESARVEAKKNYPSISGRGIWVEAVDDDKHPMRECADDAPINENLSSFLKEVNDCIQEGANVVCLCGGFSGASSVRDLIEMSGDYDTFASEFSLIVWTKSDGWLANPRNSNDQP